jgi:hypothetical protein
LKTSWLSWCCRIEVRIAIDSGGRCHRLDDVGVRRKGKGFVIESTEESIKETVLTQLELGAEVRGPTLYQTPHLTPHLTPYLTPRANWSQGVHPVASGEGSDSDPESGNTRCRANFASSVGQEMLLRIARRPRLFGSAVNFEASRTAGDVWAPTRTPLGYLTNEAT